MEARLVNKKVYEDLKTLDNGKKFEGYEIRDLLLLTVQMYKKDEH